MQLSSEVAVVVSPNQMNAPNVARVVLFRGTTEVKPLPGSDFGPREFTNRLGRRRW